MKKNSFNVTQNLCIYDKKDSGISPVANGAGNGLISRLSNLLIELLCQGLDDLLSSFNKTF